MNIVTATQTELKVQLDENEIRTCIAVFSTLRMIPYDKLNSFLGSLTIEQMRKLHTDLHYAYEHTIGQWNADDECED